MQESFGNYKWLLLKEAVFEVKLVQLILQHSAITVLTIVLLSIYLQRTIPNRKPHDYIQLMRLLLKLGRPNWIKR